MLTVIFSESKSEIPLNRPPMVLIESGLNSELVSLMRHICIKNCISLLKQVVFIARVGFIVSGLLSELYCTIDCNTENNFDQIIPEV